MSPRMPMPCNDLYVRVTLALDDALAVVAREGWPAHARDRRLARSIFERWLRDQPAIEDDRKADLLSLVDAIHDALSALYRPDVCWAFTQLLTLELYAQARVQRRVCGPTW
jgi:hypothetical protein